MSKSPHPIETIIGYTFKTPALLEKALSHPSAAPRNKDFERFEFLGDRVLGLTMADVLLELFPTEPEGHLAKRQAVLVSRESCQTVAGLIQLETHIRAVCDLGVHESNMMAILADAVEALLGAMYLDDGITSCHTFVRRFWADLFHDSKEPPKDAKSALQEWLQKRGKPTPVYIPTDVTGPAHNPTFECEVQLDGLPLFKGTGRNRRMAEQEAAKAAMAWIDESKSKKR
jgi:ribonuclease-3